MRRVRLARGLGQRPRRAGARTSKDRAPAPATIEQRTADITMKDSYQQLERHFGNIGRLQAANSLLFWDRNVVMKPAAAPAHGEVAGAMAAVIAEKYSDPRVGDWLSQAEVDAAQLPAWPAANLREMRRLHRHATALPSELKVEIAVRSSQLTRAWMQARAENDFRIFGDEFSTMLVLKREAAQRKAEAMQLAPYDALIDEHDPGVTTAVIDPLFTQLARELPPLLESVLDAQSAWTVIPFPEHAEAVQRELCEALMAQTGYDFNAGRLDTTTHPFALGNVPGDPRITTRFKPDDLRFALMATLHETGHSFYEFNLPREWSYQPVGAARGAALHESQSLMLEMQACRSLPFIRFLARQLAQRFGADNPAYSEANVVRRYHRIQRNLIRIEADEVVYPLHVILRYDIERLLLAGDLQVRDLPDAWNAKMTELIGVTPDHPGVGCLQDVHWAFGMFGMFPSYALGAAIAAQLFETASRADPSILPAIGNGDFKPYFAWVKPNVHEKASSLSFHDVIEEASGRALDGDALLRHLRRRYLPSH